MKALKLGILGVSNLFITKVLPSLKASNIVEVYGIASRNGEKAKKTALEYNISKHYTSYEELLQDKAVEIVYIPLPNHLHAEWIKKSADYGKHVICEKPLTLNANEARNAIDYANKKGVKIMEAFMYRFHPQWKRVLELVKFQEIGRITTIHTIFGYFNNDPHNIRNIKEAGGGAILDIGCYAVSTARYILGAEPKRVVSSVDYDANFQTDILAHGILDFGAVRTLFTISTQTFPCQKLQIYGTQGTITIEIPFNMYPDVPAKVTVQNSVGTRCLELGPVDQYQLEFEEFALAVQNNEAVPISPEDAVQNMKVLDALFKSAESGKWENL